MGDIILITNSYETVLPGIVFRGQEDPRLPSPAILADAIAEYLGIVFRCFIMRFPPEKYAVCQQLGIDR